MKTLITRTLYGFIFAVVVIGSILVSPYLFAVFMLSVTFVGVLEMNKLLDPKGNNAISLITAMLSFALIAGVGLNIIAQNALFLLIFPLLLPMPEALFSKQTTFSTLAAKQYAGMFFVAIPSGLTLCFYQSDFVGAEAGPFLLLGVIATIWINDTFAYLIGSIMGRHRLFERISPKKSWEGSIGGLIFALAVAAGFASYSGLISIEKAVIIALIVVVSGSFGDLIESMLKRQAGVKDSGNIIPGHGGVLDRFDATFFAIPFVFVYLLMNH